MLSFGLNGGPNGERSEEPSLLNVSVIALA